jgi:FAD/FMN-containing dehydrogenase
MAVAGRTSTWVNWAGNIRAEPLHVLRPADEGEVSAAVQSARRAGQMVRVAGAGHSFTPLCTSDGVILSLDRMSGVVGVDTGRRRVRMLPGTPLRALGDPLWRAGLCLMNQGDIDAQHIAGAVATSTHGSGLRQQSFSATARRFRIVRSDGSVAEVSEADPGPLAAAQTSLGLLGVVTELEIEVREAFALGERIEYWSVGEITERWGAEMASRRHFSFFWMPSTRSPADVFMDCPEDLDMADRALVKLYDELPAGRLGTAGEPPELDGYRRVDRAYRIYPDPDFEGEPVHRELEYMVPFDQGLAAFLAVRSLILDHYPDHTFPVEIRSIAADSAYLSPFYERPSVSVSVSEAKSCDYMSFLADVDRVLEPFEPRPHWGKIHFLSRGLVTRRYPRCGDFQRIREEFDPSGTFMNASLKSLFGRGSG